MYPFQDDADENLPDEIIAELDARNRIRANVNDEDESVFSDVVQDAFKKYQNEVCMRRRRRRKNKNNLFKFSSCFYSIQNIGFMMTRYFYRKIK